MLGLNLLRQKFVTSLSRCPFSISSCNSANLSGKTALVTAASEGIGFAIARKLGLDGARVMICSRKKEKVDKAVDALLSENIVASGMPCNVGKKTDRKVLLEKVRHDYGNVDILIPAAGVNPYYGDVLATPETAYDKIFDINVKSTFMLIQEAVPLMQSKENGSIVIVSSILGYNPADLLGIYSVSKTALLGLTKALTKELSSMNIRINCIAPGIIKTKFSGALWQNHEMEKEVCGQVALGRLGDADECAGIVSHLCSEEASYITGETIVVGGGMKSRL